MKWLSFVCFSVETMERTSSDWKVLFVSQAHKQMLMRGVDDWRLIEEIACPHLLV